MTMIYFMLSPDGQTKNKVAGENLRDEYRRQGWTVNGSVEDTVFLPYSPMKEGVWWKIENGQFVPLKTTTDITTYQNLLKSKSEKNAEIGKTNQSQSQFVDGFLTAEQYETIKSERLTKWAELKAIQDQIDQYEKEA